MNRNPDNEPKVDSLLALLLFALLLFCSPVIFVWADPQSLWYLPYVLWLLVIALGAVMLHRDRGSRHDP